MASVAVMSCQKEESPTAFIENTKWLGQVRIKDTSSSTILDVTCTIGVEFLEGGECWYNQQIFTTAHCKGTYTVSSDKKTVTLTFPQEGGGTIIETGVISADGKTMTYKSADSLLGEFTLTKQ